MNKPLVTPLFPEDRVFNKYNKGIIEAAVRGFYETKYTAFHPDSLEKPLTFQTFANSLIRLRAENNEKNDGESYTNSEIKDVDNLEGDEEGEIKDEFEGEDRSIEEDVPANQSSTENESYKEAGYEDFYERSGRLKGLDFAVDFVEDVVFDANYTCEGRIRKYLFLLWIDPQGKLRDRYLAALRFEDLINVLEQAQWRNPFNDAENRSVKEAWDLRLFNYYLINISGDEIQNLDFSRKYADKIIEFEHHLWEYN